MGPDKLPEVTHKIGSSWRALKRIQERVEAEVREAIPDLPSANDLARFTRSPVNLLNQLANRVDQKEESEAAKAKTGPATVPDRSSDDPGVVAPPVPRPTSTHDIILPPDPSLN
jgi:Sec-independent protein translocase protein TatA